MRDIKASSLCILVAAVVFIWNSFNEVMWDKTGVMIWDVAPYYGYLTKAFNSEKNVISDDEVRFPALNPPNKYVTTDSGVKVLKTAMGMSVMYSPFYAVGFLLHFINTGYSGSGLEIEYRMSMQFCGLFYLLLALFLLQYFLRKHFTEGIVALTILLLPLGTNLYYYTVYEGCMSHVSNLFLFLLFLYATEIWYRESSIKNSILLGILAGLVVLVRPTNILIGIIFLLYEVTSFKELLSRIIYLTNKSHLLLLMAFSALVVWIPQIIYWRSLTGQYFFFSYIGERFFFDNPMVYEGMIGGRKGWLLYTPMGWLILIGFIPMYKRVKNMFFSLVIFYTLFVYVIFSWWCWWYGGGFSCRAMVDTYGLLAFPLASLLSFVFVESKTRSIVAFSILLLFVIALNLFQTWQYKKGIIHYDSMNYKAYKQILFKTSYQPDSIFSAPPSVASGGGRYAE